MAGCPRPCAASSMCWHGSTAQSESRSYPSTRASWPCTAPVRRAGGWRRSQASARSALPRDRRLEDILLGAQSSGLDRVGAKAAHHRRQGPARQHHQAGQPIFAVAASRRRNGRHPLRAQARNAEAAVARTTNGTSTNQGGGCGARQQDCADGLGHHGPGRKIQGAETVAGGMSTPADRSVTPIGEGMTT
jgi:hypothetical protein